MLLPLSREWVFSSSSFSEKKTETSARHSPRLRRLSRVRRRTSPERTTVLSPPRERRGRGAPPAGTRERAQMHREAAASVFFFVFFFFLCSLFKEKLPRCPAAPALFRTLEPPFLRASSRGTLCVPLEHGKLGVQGPNGGEKARAREQKVDGLTFCSRRGTRRKKGKARHFSRDSARRRSFCEPGALFCCSTPRLGVPLDAFYAAAWRGGGRKKRGSPAPPWRREKKHRERGGMPEGNNKKTSTTTTTTTTSTSCSSSATTNKNNSPQTPSLPLLFFPSSIHSPRASHRSSRPS